MKLNIRNLRNLIMINIIYMIKKIFMNHKYIKNNHLNI